MNENEKREDEQDIKDTEDRKKKDQEEREKIPVVASGHDILWVVGYRMSEAYKITDSTRRILEIRIKQVGEENNEG